MDIEALNEKFQDLSRSVVQGIYDSDPVNASKLLEEISNQNPGIAENSKIRMKEDFAQQFKVSLILVCFFTY
jgi:hypothetical protein